MKALIIKKPGEAEVAAIPEPVASRERLLLKVRMIGLCGSDLNSFRGKNPMVTFPRIPGHEVAATIIEGSKEDPALGAGVDVTMSPYTSCGKCASCLRQRPNACQFNETLGVQRDGALTEYIAMPADKLYTANLSIKELCLVEPLTVGFHAAGRGRITETDSVAVFGCGGVGLGAIAASHFRRANTIGIDEVACFAAAEAGPPAVTMMSTLRTTSSAASPGSSSRFASAHRADRRRSAARHTRDPGEPVAATAAERRPELVRRRTRTRPARSC